MWAQRKRRRCYWRPCISWNTGAMIPAGICVAANGTIQVAKARGRLQVLRDMTQEGAQLPGHIGVGHTRWATHGEPSDVNSHPHLSQGGRVALVHNGIVENYMELREFLTEKGYTFASQTDTEIAAQLIDHCYHGDPVQAVREAVNLLTGSFALGIIFRDHPDQIIAVRKDSPLIVGLGQGENFIASDIPALLKHTRDILRLDEYELAVIRQDRVQVFDRYGDPVEKQIQHVDWDPGAAEKGGYAHFMLKEIMEQDRVLRDTLRPRVREGQIQLELKHITPEDFRDCDPGLYRRLRLPPACGPCGLHPTSKSSPGCRCAWNWPLNSATSIPSSPPIPSPSSSAKAAKPWIPSLPCGKPRAGAARYCPL